MNKQDQELIVKYLDSNFELNKLYSEHQELEGRLSRFTKKFHLTTPDEVEVKKLKRQKLLGMDRMMMIVQEASY